MKPILSLSRLFCFVFICFVLSSNAQNVEFSRANFPDQKKELRKAIRNIRTGDEFFFQETKGSYAEALDYYLQANNFNPKNNVLNFRIGVCFLKSYYKNLALTYLENAKALDPGVSPQLNLFIGEAYQYQSRFREALDAYTAYKASLDTKALAKEGDAIDKRIRECNSGLALLSNPTVTRFDRLTEKINSSYDEYCPVINSDENLMAFTSRRSSTTGGRVNPLDYLYFEDIFFTSRSATQDWENPVNPGKPLNGKTNDATIELAPDGRSLTLYKNIGGKDFICESERDNGIWVKPRKLDKEITSGRAHEPSAAFSKDRKTIYFVSDKKGGYGGNDLYMSHQDAAGNWGEAISLGSVINSPYDEEAPFIYNDSALYFSSKGFNSIGGYDIFMSKMQANGQWTAPVNMGMPLNSPADDLYLVFSENGDAYLSSDRMDGFGGFDVFHAQLNFKAEQLLAELAPVFLHGKVMDEESADGVVARIDILNANGENMVPFGTSDNLGIFVATLPSAKSYEMLIQPESCDSLVKGLDQFGTIYHPDYVPSVNDTIARTIIKGKMIHPVTGMALQFPIEIVDQSTRKVAARIIPDLEGRFEVELPSARSYDFNVMTHSCTHQPLVINTPVNYTTSVVIGMSVNIENIYFDFDRAYVRSDASEILNRHALLFKNYPNWKILISGHTDNMGSEEYNMVLSRKRAQSVADYLVSKGVRRHQLKLEWYGYNQPVTANNTEEGRQLNRRCELSVIKD